MLPDTTKLANQFAKEIREASVLGAMAYNAIHGLQSDDISENDAFKKYGKSWIKDRVSRGQVHFARTGTSRRSTKVYSVFEIETLKRAEKCLTEIYNEVIINNKH